MGSIKEINIKNRTNYFFNDMNNIKYFDSNVLKIDKSHTKTLYLLHGYITIKNISDYESILNVNHFYLIIGEVDGCIEKSNGNKYLIVASTDKNKEVLKTTQKFGMGLKI